MVRARWLIALVCAAAGTLALFATGTTAAQQSEPTTTTTPEEPGNAVGEEIWSRDCAICHGERGGGSIRAPALVGVGPAGVDFMVRTGRMPIDEPDDSVVRGEVDYTEAEVAVLVEHVATFLEGPAVPDVSPAELVAADEAKGGELYRLECASCHQLAGQGGVLIAGTDVPPIGPADAVEVIEAMRAGPNNMPVFPEAIIDEHEALDIAAYVQDLDDPTDEGGWALGHWGPVPEGAAAFAFGLVPIVLLTRWLGDRNLPAPQEDEVR